MNRHVHRALGDDGVKSLPATPVNVHLTKNRVFYQNPHLRKTAQMRITLLISKLQIQVIYLCFA
jgi:hypothetical protein